MVRVWQRCQLGERCHFLCHSTLIVTRSPFSSTVTFGKTQSHFGLPSSLRGGYKEITGQTPAPCSKSPPPPTRNDTDQKIGVPLSQSVHRTATMGSPYLLVISRFLTASCHLRLLSRKMRLARRHDFFFKIREKKVGGKQKEGGKCFTPRRAPSLPWSVVSGQIDPGNKGSFPPPARHQFKRNPKEPPWSSASEGRARLQLC